MATIELLSQLAATRMDRIDKLFRRRGLQQETVDTRLSHLRLVPAFGDADDAYPLQAGNLT